MSNNCPSIEKCPIYTGVLKGKEMTSKAYRQYFCQTKEYVTCKRYMVKESTGTCPPDILPNSFQSVEDIIIKYNLEKIV